MLLRAFAWAMVSLTLVFVANAGVTFWLDWPGTAALFGGGEGNTALAAVQVLSYLIAIALPLVYAMRTPDRDLRAEAETMSLIVRVLIRFAFWAVLLIGIADITVSFLRVEELLADFVGEDRAAAWGFNANRAPELHLPMIGIALVLAFITPTLGFHWLALFVVLAELLIVFTRFVFSYEQAFQADLVRFWYGALFLFASAHTLVEDGHVRVDVFYANMRRRSQGAVNAFGCLVMGILFCWVILYFGMATGSSVITAPLLSLEVTQAGFGMYVKYLMAGFLGVFAVSMMIQFSAYLLESWADWRGDPGGAPHHVHGHDGEHVTEV
ncbi:MAG: TRAP transporter small permease subunit [Pseudomonadota bacterium]